MLCTVQQLPHAWGLFWSVSQSIDYIFSSHLGLIICLTLIIRVGTQHHVDTFTQKPEHTHKVILPKKCTMIGTVSDLCMAGCVASTRAFLSWVGVRST